MERFIRIFVAALTFVWLACWAPALAKSHSTSNDVLITNSLSPATFTPQVMLLLNYGGNAITLIDTSVTPHTRIQLYNSTSQPTNGSGVGSISYFYLPTSHTAQFKGYSASNPFWVSLWCPVDTSSNGQNPATSWFNNTCFGYPNTLNAPMTSVPAGATLVETKLLSRLGDTIDISEVNGVTAQWSVQLPNGGWCAGAFRNASLPPNYPQIQWSTIMNQPGNGSKYYGDYGNPGVYPFGCTNCVSRYNNGALAAGCNNASYNFFNYPAADKGCDNAINPNEPMFTSPPPTVLHPLPTDAFWKPYPHMLYNPGPAGYRICQLSPSSGNPTVRPGGTVQITLLKYPFGQVQTTNTLY